MNSPQEKDIQLDRYNGGETSFVDLYRIAVNRKLVIFAVFAVTLLMAILYTSIVQPTYEAKVRLLEPNSSMTILTSPSHPYAAFDPEAVFQGFQAQLKLMDQWRVFMERNPDWFPVAKGNELPQTFGRHPIKFSRDSDFPAKHVDVSYQYHSLGLPSEILGQYLEFTRESYLADLVALVRNRIEREKDEIALDIVMLRKRAELAKGDEMDRLREDLALAKSLGITENLLVRSSEASRVGSDIAIIATNETVRSYMRGTNVLGAELEALLNRESNDPYILGLREKQIELERLNNLRINPENFMPYIQDGEIFGSSEPVRPNKIMAFSAAIVVGLFFGLLAAYAFESLARAQRF